MEEARLQAGQSQKLAIQIKRKWAFPFVWYVVSERWSDESAAARGQMIFPWFRRDIRIEVELPQLKRGV